MFQAGILQSLTPLLAPRKRRSRITPAPEKQERDEAKEISAIGEVWALSPCIDLRTKLLSPPGFFPFWSLASCAAPSHRYSFCRQSSGADERRHSLPTPCRVGHFLLLSAFPSPVFACLVSAVRAQVARQRALQTADKQLAQTRRAPALLWFRAGEPNAFPTRHELPTRLCRSRQPHFPLARARGVKASSAPR